MRRNMKLGEFIEVLKPFPQDWDILIQPPNSEDTYGIKGVYAVSESNWEMPQYDYVDVVIEAMPWALNPDQLTGEDSIEMYGDRNWYNTLDIFEQDVGKSKVNYQLTEDGKVKILSCYDSYLHDMPLDDALDEQMKREKEWEEYCRRSKRFNVVDDFIRLVNKMESYSKSENNFNDCSPEDYKDLKRLSIKLRDMLWHIE